MKTLVNFFRNLRLGVKLAVGFSLLVVLTLAVVSFGYLGSVPATSVINRTSALRVPAALTSARAQAITARLGDVSVKANDDVRLNGERVRLNC